ncbi:MAG: four helix bundle protein [Candidatus Kapaibacteriales bacterium]
MQTLSFKEQNKIYDKLEHFVLSIDDLSFKLNGDLFNFKYLLRDCVREVPNKVKEGFSSNHKVSHRKSLAFAKESLEQCKHYLSMMNQMKIGSTKELIKQVEEINKLLEGQSKIK